MKKLFVRRFIPFYLFFYVLSAYGAAPTVSSVTSETGTFQNGVTVKVQGSNFGTKTQAAPVLLDSGRKVYENGVLNSSRESKVDGSIVEPSTPGISNPDPIYAKPSDLNTSSNPSIPVNFVASGEMRYAGETGYYAFTGPSGYVGWPRAYGGINPPGGHDVVYESWWMKINYPINRYFLWTMTNIKGTFDSKKSGSLYGEDLRFSNGHTGKVIAVNGDVIQFIADTPTVDYIMNTTITGVQSGATATIAHSSYHYAPGSEKWTRIWANINGTSGVLAAWSNVGLAVRKANSTENIYGYDPVADHSSGVVAGKWNHMEVMLDFRNNIGKAWVNSHELYNIDLTGARADNNIESPTMALIGVNGNFMSYLHGEFGDIYFDNTRQRILLANSPTLASASHTEVEYPLSWSDSKIEFRLNFGSFTSTDTVYVYVLNQDGMENSKGVCIMSCTSPPSAPSQLQVN